MLARQRGFYKVRRADAGRQAYVGTVSTQNNQSAGPRHGKAYRED
jgi:hypothetical protein